MKTMLIVDGICPRGLAIVRYLSSIGEYHILVFSKDNTSPAATAISSLPGVTLLLNRANTGYDLPTFVAAAQQCPSVLICSTATNAEGSEGVRWGARLAQSAASAGVKHLVFLAMDASRKQFSTDSYICTQGKTQMAWTIMRSPATGALKSEPSSTPSEIALTAGQLRNLAHYVTWVFSNVDRSTGLDFVLPNAETSGMNSDPQRQDDQAGTAYLSQPTYLVQGVQPHPDIHSALSSSECPSGPRTTSARQVNAPSRLDGSAYMNTSRVRAVQQWVIKTIPNSRGKDVESEEECDQDDDDSGSESE